jgi:hypothetical protein
MCVSSCQQLGSFENIHILPIRVQTYCKHREFTVVVQKSLLLPQLFILADAFTEEMTNACVACQHQSTYLLFICQMSITWTMFQSVRTKEMRLWLQQEVSNSNLSLSSL